MDVQEQINETGERMVRCKQDCSGIISKPTKGILPRCLYFEQSKMTGLGTVVVGINPGNAGKEESNSCRTSEPSYQLIVEYWQESLCDTNRYYIELRNLVKQLDLQGPILWTELAKCQNRPNVKHVPLDTFRTCTRLYLRREIEILPKDWPLIAVGRKAFNALAYLFPDRAIVGVPHPTGSRGNFRHMFDAKDRLHSKIKKQAQGTWKQGASKCIWLKSAKHYHGSL